MYKKVILFLLTLLLWRTLPAQIIKPVYEDSAAAESALSLPATGSKIKQNGTPQEDITDLLKSLFHKKSTGGKNDLLILKPEFSFVTAPGYTLQSRLILTLAGNCAFRTAPTARLSTITASAAWSQNKQFIMPVQSSIWTKNSRYNLVGDIRFYKYPQSTFGLGSASDVSAEDPMSYNLFRLHEIGLRQLTGSFYAGAGYLLDYRWNIIHQKTLDSNPEGYQVYGTARHTISSGFSFNALYDTRNNAINPTTGMYATVRFRVNSKWTGSTTNWQSMVLDVRKYDHLPAHSKNILAFWSYNWLVLGGKPPYLDLPSTAWDASGNTGRGYIQGRFRGTKMIYGEMEYRFGITRNGLLGGVAFVNAQSLAAGPGTTLQKVQPACGGGLRIKLNKVSNTNITIDYGFGTQGSKGLFINIGETF